MRTRMHPREIGQRQPWSTMLALVAMLLVGCQPIQPVTPAPALEPALATYGDPNGFFSVAYPSGWIAQGYTFADAPFPHAVFGSNQAIIDASTADERLPEGQIGVAIMVLPQAAFAEAGIGPHTSLDESASLLLMAMADDPDAVAAMIGGATFAATTLANGTPAVLVTAEGPAEAYLLTLAELGDGLYLFAPQILALGYRNAELEAQVAALVNSFALTATGEQVLAFAMAQMAAPEDSAMVRAETAPTVTFTAVEAETGLGYAGPDAIPGGLTRIEFVNPGAQEHTLWLIRLDAGKSFDDVMGVFMALESDPRFPDWMTWYGGVTAPPGSAAAYTVELAPGTYSLFSFSENAEGLPDAAQGMVKTLLVDEAPAGAATPPAADLRVELVDFSFVIEGTPTSGKQVVEVANTGMEPHELILLKLADDASLQDALEFMLAGEEAEGMPPFEFFGGAGPIGAGMTAWYEADIPPGNYGLICFVPSPTNEGAPHLMLGMAQQVRLP